MTREQAIQVLEQVVAQFRGTPAECSTVVSAFEHIKAETPKAVPPKEATTT